MRADLEPMDAARNRQTKSTVVQTHSDAVKAAVAHGLELQRSVRRIGLEQCVASVSEGLNVSGQRFQALPEAL